MPLVIHLFIYFIYLLLYIHIVTYVTLDLSNYISQKIIIHIQHLKLLESLVIHIE